MELVKQMGIKTIKSDCQYFAAVAATNPDVITIQPYKFLGSAFRAYRTSS